MDQETTELLRNLYHKKTPREQLQFLQNLSNSQFNEFFYSPIMLQDYQIIPETNWHTCVYLAGRGSGKTFTASEWLANQYRLGHKDLAMVAATHADLVKTMVPAFINRFALSKRPRYIGGSKNYIQFSNGDKVQCFSLTSSDQVRGANAEKIWLDEVIKACDSIPEKIEEAINNVILATRIGTPQILITTTPKPFSFIKNWIDRVNNNDPSIIIKHGSTKQNKYISQSAKDQFVKLYGTSRYALQELEGVVSFDVDGALWNQQLIDSTRAESVETIANPPNPNNIRKYNNPYNWFKKFWIGIDPATTANENSDSWGIVVSALGPNNHCYVLEDHSAVMTPGNAAIKIDQLFKRFTINTYPSLVAETNQGGDMVNHILRSVNNQMVAKTIHVTKGKISRLHPVLFQALTTLLGKLELID